MGRRPDPYFEERKKRAAKLKQEGMKPAEIGDLMGVKTNTVQKWLQAELGPQKPPFRTRIVEMLKEGKDFETIITQTGSKYENVRKVEREIRSKLPVGYSFRDRRIERYMSAPKIEVRKRYAMSESFGKDLVHHCTRATNTDPKGAKPVLELGEVHFETLIGVLRSPQKLQAAICSLAQVKAAGAARDRALERPRRALRTIRSLIENSSCHSCEADLARRESIILRDLGKFPLALKRIGFSERAYEQIGHNGHDFSNNGLGNCALVRVTILYCLERFADAVNVADNACEALIQPSDGALFFRVRYNRTQSLAWIPGREKEASRAARELLAECGEAPSLPRLFVAHLLGSVAEKLDCGEEALSYYQDAAEDADALELPAAASALEADIGRLTANPSDFQERVSRLLEGADWMSPLSGVLSRILEASEKDLLGAIAALRKESGGDVYLPRFVVA